MKRLIILLMVIFTSGLAYGAQIQSDSARRELIRKEMDCISENLNKKVEWADVCYTKEEPSVQSSREKIILEELDMYERAQRNSHKESASPELTTSENLQNSNPPSIDAQDEKSYDSDSGARNNPLKNDFRKYNLQLNDLVQVEVQFLGGYRQDSLKWNVASDLEGVTTPNIISELNYDPIRMAQVQGRGKVIFANHFVFDALADYGKIYSGMQQDSDYLGNDRSDEFSRSNNITDQDYVLDLSSGIGYKFYLGSAPDFWEASNLWLTFLYGYSYHEQNLVTSQGNQTLGDGIIVPLPGPFPGLEETYDTEWNGKWIGIELEGKSEKIFGSFRFEYHWADYYAKADWNLRDDFAHPVSFEDDAQSKGLVFRLGGGYRLTNNWKINGNVDIQIWDTKPGVKTFYLADGSSGQQRLNQVLWNSFAVTLGATYSFF